MNRSKQSKTGALREKAQLMSASEIDRTMVRLANEILERNNGLAGVVLVGIRRRGVPLAERLARKMKEIEKVAPPVETLDVTSHRDDLSPGRPTREGREVAAPQEVAGAFTVEGKAVILVDDVIHTGRTTRAALDALLDHGRPQRVELCVLIDRGLRELPIQATYVGRMIQTSELEFIEVSLQEIDNEERVKLCERIV